ncbi:hypothetical protein BCV73_08990 [Paenibacillus sp. SSG-1]|nr:hypothetical protein [Paenibacillus sp. SSG-1]OXL83200.1 hypothetical protein BCV73_08990 [Paenibacillus sp. SSG-1]
MKLMSDFLKLVRADTKAQGLTSADHSVQSHLMAFAAEESRIAGEIIRLKEFEQRYAVREPSV